MTDDLPQARDSFHRQCARAKRASLDRCPELTREVLPVWAKWTDSRGLDSVEGKLEDKHSPHNIQPLPARSDRWECCTGNGVTPPASCCPLAGGSPGQITPGVTPRFVYPDLAAVIIRPSFSPGVVSLLASSACRLLVPTEWPSLKALNRGFCISYYKTKRERERETETVRRRVLSYARMKI